MTSRGVRATHLPRIAPSEHTRPMKHSSPSQRIAIQLAAPDAARVERLRGLLGLGAAKPSRASTLGVLAMRGLAATEAELGVAPSTPPPPSDPH